MNDARDATLVRCGDCSRVSPVSSLSTSGPIKEIDEDGKLHRRWFHVCPWCFGASLAPIENSKPEEDNDDETRDRHAQPDRDVRET